MRAKSVAPLKHISKIKLSLLLWEHLGIPKKNIKYSEWGFMYLETKTPSKCVEVHKQIEEKLLTLPLPTNCVDDIKELLTLPWYEASHWLLPNAFWYSSYDAFKDHIEIYFESIFWTDTGFINLKKSLTSLFTTNLPVVHKYRLACMHCLEDDVAVIWKQLPSYLVEDIMNDRGIFLHCPCTFRIVQYWSYYVTRSVYRLVDKLQLQSEQELYCFMLECIVNSREENFFALQYFWQLLTDENKELHKLQIAKSILQNNHCRSTCYIASQMKPAQLKEFMNKEFVFLWKKKLFIPFTICIARCFENTIALSDALVEISERPFLSLRGNMVVVGLWRENNFIPANSSYENDIWLSRMFQDVIHQYSNWCFTLEVELKMLKEEIALAVRDSLALILINSSNIQEDLKRIDLFLKWCYPSLEEISGFKEIAIALALGVHMSPQTILEGDIEKFDAILNWCFSSQEKIIDFKEYSIGFYVFQQKESIILEVVNSRTIDTVKVIDRVLNWCLLTQDKIASFKESSITHELRQSLVLQVVNSKNVDDDIQRIEFIFHWFFSSDDKVKYFKNHTMASDLKNTLILQIINCENFKKEIKRIDTILNWSLSDEGDITDFKENHVAFHIKNKIVRLMKGLSDEKDIKEIDVILNWCFPTVAKMNKFKEDIITNQLKYDFGQQLMNSNNVDWDFKTLDNILNWCFSTQEKVTDFKENVIALHLQQKIGLLIDSKDLDNLEKVDVILTWCFSTQEGIDKFKDTCRTSLEKEHWPVGPHSKKPKVITEEPSENSDSTRNCETLRKC